MKKQELEKLANRIFEANSEAGWHETPRTTEDDLLLVQSEAFEAFESFRKQQYADPVAVAAQKAYFNPNEFKQLIKDTFEDEIADVAIRILDTAGKNNLELDDIRLFGTAYKGCYPSDLRQFNSAIHGMISDKFTTTNAMLLLNFIFSVARTYHFDIIQHIELKLQYNATRGHRHGNKIL